MRCEPLRAESRLAHRKSSRDAAGHPERAAPRSPGLQRSAQVRARSAPYGPRPQHVAQPGSAARRAVWICSTSRDPDPQRAAQPPTCGTTRRAHHPRRRARALKEPLHALRESRVSARHTRWRHHRIQPRPHVSRSVPRQIPRREPAQKPPLRQFEHPRQSHRRRHGPRGGLPRHARRHRAPARMQHTAGIRRRIPYSNAIRPSGRATVHTPPADQTHPARMRRLVRAPHRGTPRAA